MILTTLGTGIRSDVANRVPYYVDDWQTVKRYKLRVLASATYIFFASAIPALAFGEQIAIETNGILNGVHVLAATAISGVAQAVIGGQPLLIVGVAEPIVLVYSYMYQFAEDKSELLPYFLPWASWVCVWTAVFMALLAIFNAANYIKRFTRFAGELFGMLIAMLFLQQAIKGVVNEFSAPDGGSSEWQTVNGLWGLFLSFGLCISSLLIRKARSWRFLKGWLRALLADYGVALMVVAYSGLSFAVDGPGVPQRVLLPNTWDVTGTWSVVTEMGNVPGKYIAGALIPAILISILFYFDHSVSSQLAQQEEFNLTKPSAYHYDLLLVGGMSLAMGLIGVPPVNGVLPQAPMHTKSLAKVTIASSSGSSKEKLDKQQQQQCDSHETPMPATIYNTNNNNGIDNDIIEPPTRTTAVDEGEIIRLQVAEQRGSNLLQSLAVGVCLGITPALKQIPSAVLWGYFAFMAFDSLPGSQFWDRLLLLVTDPKRRYKILERSHAPYLETVPMKVIVQFTLLQLALLLLVYGLTWASIAGVLFPIPIMLLVPFRQYIMPKWFKNEYLEALDAMKEEAVEPLQHEVSLYSLSDEEDLREVLDQAIIGRRQMVVHHVVHPTSSSSQEGGGVVGLNLRRRSSNVVQIGERASRRSTDLTVGADGAV